MKTQSAWCMAHSEFIEYRNWEAKQSEIRIPCLPCRQAQSEISTDLF